MNENNRKRIKVLYIQVPAGGGSMIALYEMVRHLDKNVIEPVILCFYKNKFSAPLETIENCRMIYLFENKEAPEAEKSQHNHGKVINYLFVQANAIKSILYNEKRLVKKVFQIMSDEKPDLVHHNNDILLNRSCVRAAKKAGIKQIVHNRSLAGYGNNFVSFIHDFFLIKSVSFRIDITNSVSKHFNKLFHLTPDNCIVIPDIIDVKKYYPSNPNNLLRREFRIRNGEYLITCIGRLTKWKGQHILIEALNMLRDESSNIKVLLVGPNEDGVGSKQYANELKQMIANFGLQDRIIFTGNRNDIPAIINISDIVVHTSVKPEPQGMVIIEALLCGKKVIASGNSGSGELIDKYGGMAIRPGDASALALLLQQQINNKGINSNGISEHKYKKLRADFDAEKQANNLMGVYKKVLVKE